MPHVLFLCWDNVSLSPMAEGLARSFLAASEDPDFWEVSSAGVKEHDGFEAVEFARQVLAEQGIDLPNHRSRTLTSELLARVSVAVAMSWEIKKAAQSAFPEHARKVVLLGELTGAQYDVIDPYGGPIDDYRDTLGELEYLLPGMLARLDEIFRPETRSRRRWPIVRTVALVGGLAAAVISLIVWQGQRRPETSLDDEAPVMVQAAVETRPGAPVELSLDSLDVAVFVPENAIIWDQDLVVRLSGSRPDAFPEAGPDWVRPRVVNLEFYDAVGTLVSEADIVSPIEVCFRMIRRDWSSYVRNPDTYAIQFYNDTLDSPQWVDLPILAKESNRQLCGQVMHLSLFALAVKLEEGQPRPEFEQPSELYSP